MKGRWPLVLPLLLLLPLTWPAEGSDAARTGDCRDCDREMRKTFEAMQAWRRTHHGRYPLRLADLRRDGFLPPTAAVCPDLLHERLGADGAHSQVSSRRRLGDPDNVYEYELSDLVNRGEDARLFLPPGTDITRYDLKAVLLRRPFFEQIPILRCSSHRAMAPPPTNGFKNERRNLTVEGKVYWSPVYWEQLWLDDVPYPARDLNVMFGLKGPPFFVERSPTLPDALDLSRWSCAFGDHAWWWTFPNFEGPPNRQTPAPHLRAFFQEQHGRTLTLAGAEWWLNGLVQLQGKISSAPANRYKQAGILAFVWEKRGLPVHRLLESAEWLQGTVWTAEPGAVTGWLVWHYDGGREEHVPLVYGSDTARFWGGASQLQMETGFVPPVWSITELDPGTGRERQLRLYRQSWRNPHPTLRVTHLDFVSNRECPAAPFLVAVNVRPPGKTP
jgi:hypothetical protein